MGRLGSLLGGLGAGLGRSWVVLGRSWGGVERSWGVLASWGDLGRSWGGLGAVLGGLGAVLGRSWAVLGGLGLPFPPSGLVTNSPKSGATPLLPPSSLRNFTSFFFSFFASSWLPLGLPFGAFLAPKLAQVGPKLPLDTLFVRKHGFSKKTSPALGESTILEIEVAQDRPMMAPRSL